MSLTEDQDSDTAPQTTAPPGLDAMPGLDLASLLASRMCHDFISPASAIQSGLDLLEDPQAQDMRDDAMALISGSARKLVDMLQFSRVAFGGGAELAEGLGGDDADVGRGIGEGGGDSRHGTTCRLLR